MSKSQRAREMKAANPSLSTRQIAEAQGMAPIDVLRALRRKQSKTWATRLANLARQEQAA